MPHIICTYFDQFAISRFDLDIINFKHFDSFWKSVVRIWIADFECPHFCWIVFPWADIRPSWIDILNFERNPGITSPASFQPQYPINYFLFIFLDWDEIARCCRVFKVSNSSVELFFLNTPTPFADPYKLQIVSTLPLLGVHCLFHNSGLFVSTWYYFRNIVGLGGLCPFWYWIEVL